MDIEINYCYTTGGGLDLSMTMESTISKLSNLKWYLFKKERQYGDHGTTCTGYTYYFSNKPKQYIAIIDNGNVHTLLSWNLTNYTVLPHGLQKELKNLNIIVPKDCIHQNNFNIANANYSAVNILSNFAVAGQNTRYFSAEMNGYSNGFLSFISYN